MQVFKNKNFVKRDPECQNVVAALAFRSGFSLDGHWEAADRSILEGLTHLYTQAGVDYYGYA